MLKAIKKFLSSSAEVKLFVLNNAIYVIAIAASTIYCYARIDYNKNIKISTLKSQPMNENP